MATSPDTFPVIEKRPIGHLPVRELTPDELARSRQYHGLPPGAPIEELRQRRIHTAIEELCHIEPPDQFSIDFARTYPPFALAINQTRQDIARCSALLKAEGVELSANVLRGERARRSLARGFRMWRGW